MPDHSNCTPRSNCNSPPPECNAPPDQSRAGGQSECVAGRQTHSEHSHEIVDLKGRASIAEGFDDKTEFEAALSVLANKAGRPIADIRRLGASIVGRGSSAFMREVDYHDACQEREETEAAQAAHSRADWA